MLQMEIKNQADNALDITDKNKGKIKNFTYLINPLVPDVH